MLPKRQVSCLMMTAPPPHAPSISNRPERLSARLECILARPAQRVKRERESKARALRLRTRPVPKSHERSSGATVPTSRWQRQRQCSASAHQLLQLAQRAQTAATERTHETTPHGAASLHHSVCSDLRVGLFLRTRAVCSHRRIGDW